jgi:hypothetical protein
MSWLSCYRSWVVVACLALVGAQTVSDRWSNLTDILETAPGLDARRDCAAHGDGSADDTAALQICLQRAARGEGDGRLMLNGGIYLLSSHGLSLEKGRPVEILGAGARLRGDAETALSVTRGRIRLSHVVFDGSFACAIDSFASFITLDDFSMIVKADTGVYLKASSHLLLSTGSSVESCSSYAVYVAGTDITLSLRSGSRIEKSRVIVIGFGNISVTLDDASLIACEVHVHNSQRVATRVLNHALIDGAAERDTSSRGCLYFDQCANCSLELRDHAKIHMCRVSVKSGNNFSLSLQDGSSIVNSDTDCVSTDADSRQTSISLRGHSRIDGCNGAGVRIRDKFDFKVEIAEMSGVTGCGLQGIDIETPGGGAVEVTSGAAVSFNQLHGIRMDCAGNTTVRIDGASFSGNFKGGLSLAGDALHVAVNDAIIKDSADGDGLHLLASGGSVATISKSCIFNCSRGGLWFFGMRATSLESVSIYDTHAVSLYVSGGGLVTNDLVVTRSSGIAVRGRSWEGDNISVTACLTAVDVHADNDDMAVSLRRVRVFDNAVGLICSGPVRMSVTGLIYFNMRSDSSDVNDCVLNAQPLPFTLTQKIDAVQQTFRQLHGKLHTGMFVGACLVACTSLMQPWPSKLSDLRALTLALAATSALAWGFLALQVFWCWCLARDLHGATLEDATGLVTTFLAFACVAASLVLALPRCTTLRFSGLADERRRLQRLLRDAQIHAVVQKLEASLWTGDDASSASAGAEAKRLLGWSDEDLEVHVGTVLRRHSLEAGVSVAYLLSDEFLELARARTGLENPRFLDMKRPFWLGEAPIGREVSCPRDGRAGCALVDTLPREFRGPCTHFLSWVWGYTILQVRDALRLWARRSQLDPSATFLFMCFFVNNQFRILADRSQAGSDDLRNTFERNLKRIGKVVALLDHWERPVYLSRIWCIFEQYTALKLGVPVEIILTEERGEEIIAEINRGELGIRHILTSLSDVDARKATATIPIDEVRVKAEIERAIGFAGVNARVKASLVSWVAAVVHSHMDAMVADCQVPPCTPAVRGIDLVPWLVSPGSPSVASECA